MHGWALQIVVIWLFLGSRLAWIELVQRLRKARWALWLLDLTPHAPKLKDFSSSNSDSSAIWRQTTVQHLWMNQCHNSSRLCDIHSGTCHNFRFGVSWTTRRWVQLDSEEGWLFVVTQQLQNSNAELQQCHVVVFRYPRCWAIGRFDWFMQLCDSRHAWIIPNDKICWWLFNKPMCANQLPDVICWWCIKSQEITSRCCLDHWIPVIQLS